MDCVWMHDDDGDVTSHNGMYKARSECNSDE